MRTQICVYIDIEMAQRLNEEGNKSEVVRKALRQYYGLDEDQD